MGKITISPVGKLTFKAVMDGHTIVVSEPEKIGGPDAGPAPSQLLIISIGTCTAMYADLFCERYKISSKGFKIEMDYTQEPKTTQVQSLKMTVSYPTELQKSLYPVFDRFLKKCAVTHAIKDGFEISIESA
ncbi:OsmC family protein [bacterium]|nr:OsmC family protein [bacterium]